MDLTHSYNTELTPAQEYDFQQWLALKSQAEGRDASRDLADYDLRGAWLSSAEASANGHLPDAYKKPNHPTFSSQSQYSDPANPGGRWSEQPDQSWIFRASPANLLYQSPQALTRYFQSAESTNRLMLPPTP